MLNPAQQIAQPIPNLASASPVAALDPAETPLVRPNVAGSIGFIALAGLCMTNINFVTAAMLNTEQAFSILYLIACLVTLFSFGFKMNAPIGAPGRFWMFSIVLFLAISTRMGFGIDKAYFLSPQSNFYRILIAQMITICAAMGARHLMLRGKMQLMLRILFGFTVLAASTILLTKVFPQILRYMGETAQGRSGGFFTDPNRAGQAVCISASIGFACLINEVPRFKVFIYAGLLALVPCLFLTYSRSSIAFMLLLIALQFFISPIFKQKETIIGVLLVASAIPVGIFFVLSQRGSNVNLKAAAQLERQQERMLALFALASGDFSEENTGYRTRVAGVGLKYFRENPIIGAGFRKLVKMPEIGLGCHNTFLRVFGEAGLFAGLCFAGAVFFVAFCGWLSKSIVVRCLVVGYIAMYSCSCMVSHSVLTNRITNVMLGVCLGLLTGAITMHRAELRRRRQMKMARTQTIAGYAQMPSVPGAAPGAAPNVLPS